VSFDDIKWLQCGQYVTVQLYSAEQALFCWSLLCGRTATFLLTFHPNFIENTTKVRCDVMVLQEGKEREKKKKRKEEKKFTLAHFVIHH
jgi:hypothetical protein